VLVSDRHDNIGMDEVVRAVADEAGATVVLDAGDDTSTGESWEEFSLSSLDTAFEGYDAKVAVSGNHDNGNFVNRHLASLGWTHLDGEAVEPFGGVRITGVDDPRSSGLGTWREETDLSFAEVKERIAEDVCELDEQGERIATLLVHDANLGAIALARGCTDLVLAGHLHAQVGPDRVLGENGEFGYTYTNGTTGGAAYAIAIGSKLRRDAQFTFVTYNDSRPVGIQPVTVRTTGELVVADYIELDLG
jgi:predicted phosphodiesterase